MLPQALLSPIPAPPFQDWSKVPPPADCGEGLADPTALSPKIIYRSSYAKQKLPGAMEQCLLRETVSHMLCRAADRLPPDYSILIFDALRPLSVQRAIYEQFRVRFLQEKPGISEDALEKLLDDFVAKPVKRPERPAPHTTGGAVDLTLCKNGIPLDMGAGFDDLDRKSVV